MYAYASKKSLLFENLNDVDLISMPMFATCWVTMEQIILVHEKLQIGICFSAASSQQTSVRISQGPEAKTLIFVVERRL